MDKQELKRLVTELLQQMEPAQTVEAASGESLPDLTKVDLREQYLVPDPKHGETFARLKKKTSARLGQGRCGARYLTASMLRFRADHAAAQDSVFSLVPKEFYEKNGLPFVQTMCRDKDEYLTRPDLGRKFDEENAAKIRKVCGNAKVLIILGDGLSSDAIVANGIDCADAIRQGLKSFGIQAGESIFVQFARVGAGDHIGEITGADLVCILVGERPGLATSESMSAYITFGARPGIAEAKRTVVSNIHRHGTPAVEAGAHIAELIKTMLEQKASGIDLR